MSGPGSAASTPAPDPTFAVELYFDAAAERAILELRALLYQTGVQPSPQLLDSRPHLSLVVAAAPSAEPLQPLVVAFAERVPPLPVTIEAVAAFAGSGHVLYLAPTPTPALLEHQAAFHAALAGLEVEPWEHYQPGRWIPHCTLEMDVPTAALGHAFGAVRDALQPIEGRLEEIGLVSLPPLKKVAVTPLKG